MQNDLTLTKSRKHFEILDGLRGVAALAVVIFHFMEMFIPNYSEIFIAHGFLAVDFFFCLSGFVIAYAYDERIKSMSLKHFFALRLIRLHPLVVLGTLLGLMAFIFDPYVSEWTNYSTSKLVLLTLVSMFLIPYPVMPERAFNLFGLNAPSWTLFWEYVANIFYALFLHRLKKQWFLLGAMVMAVVLFYVISKIGNIAGGWSKDNFWDGGVRIGFSFLAGMCIYRYQWIIKNRLNFPLLAILLSFAFLFPYRLEWNRFSEFIIIVFYFPLLIALGAGSLSGNRYQKTSNLLGQLSYPLYITHYFVLWAFGNYFNTQHPDTQTLTWVIPSLIVMQLIVAYLSMKFYDVPIRKYLSRLVSRE